MHTVIILNKHTSDLLRDFRFLFKPFLTDGSITFCDWNESGTDIESSVPDLYKRIKGKQDWRAVVLNTESMNDQSRYVASDEKNPFDFAKGQPENIIPHESEIPLIRLTHMLCGYPQSVTKNFERGYEYEDDTTGKICRIRVSEMTEQEIYELSSKYGERLKSIYMEEKIPEEVTAAQKAMVEKYSFTDVRPREMILISTRRHFNDEENIYASWKTQLEMESSDFCRRNNYPSSCRFLCYSITNAENSMYMKELIEFWLSVLTLSLNRIQASTLQAYKLYRLGVKVSTEELDHILNNHLNKMYAALQLVEQRIKIRPEYSFEEEAELIGNQIIPVTFEGSSGQDLLIDTSEIGLSKDCPKDEMNFWNFEVRDKVRGVERYLKAPRRAVDKAAQYLKDRTDSFYGDEYELDRFQITDLIDQIEQLENEILSSDTRSLVDEAKIRENLKKTDKQVKKDISLRIYRDTAIKLGSAMLILYFLGFLPYLVNSYKLGTEQFISAIVLVIVSILLTASGGLIALAILRVRMQRSMERFNDVVRSMIRSVHASSDRFEKYFSTVCAYMKAQSIFRGIKLKDDTLSSTKFNLRAHKQALRACMERDEELAVSYGIRRSMEVVHNVTSFFDENKLPKDNSLYYFEASHPKTEIPMNDAGDMIRTPYGFVAKLIIEREDIFDDMKGED